MNRADSPSLWLVGGWLAVGPRKAVRADLEIRNGRIRRVIDSESGARPAPGPSVEIDLEGYLILPGLINAHDHLEFNLFPRLGKGPYANSEEWARDVYRPERSPLREHLCVAKRARLWWGGLKNLLCGVTTVSHHNPYDDKVFGEHFPVRVVRRYGWAHSMVFENDVPRAFRATGPDAPFIIHLGEGTDARSRGEIFDLDRLGALDGRTVLVHGVALSPEGHALRRRRGAALVWCPTSNRFTLAATLEANSISLHEDIALGNDSALTARGDLLDEIRAAHNQDGVSADALYRMVTDSASAILRLKAGEGRLRPGAIADLIAIPAAGRTPAEALARASLREIEMVLVSGRPKLFSAAVARRWPRAAAGGFEWITVGATRRLVCAPVRWLLNEAGRHLPGGLRLAGRAVRHD